jgi:hypothetical protein
VYVQGRADPARIGPQGKRGPTRPFLLEPETFAMTRLLSLPTLLFAPWFLAVATPATAQMLADRISLHPEHIAADAPFLILVEDYWPNGCGGELQVEVRADSIEILARTARFSEPRACTEALQPFTRLINPRDFAPQGFRFAAAVKVNYRFDAGSGTELRESEDLVFSELGNAPAAAEIGTWTTPLLENSGLFIDQQGDLLTAALFDYDAQGRASWHYTGAFVNGNVLIGPMQRYGQAVCVTTPCPRALPVGTGQVRMLIDGRSRIWVEYDNVLAAGLPSGAIEYRRLDFVRNPELEGVGLDAPDLVGRWIGGVSAASNARGEPVPAALGQWELLYGGYDNQSGLPQLYFHAYAAPFQVVDGRPPAAPLAYRVECSDKRPVDGPVECVIESFPHPLGACRISFAFEAAGYSQINAKAECGSPNAEFGANFHLFRLPPGG